MQTPPLRHLLAFAPPALAAIVTLGLALPATAAPAAAATSPTPLLAAKPPPDEPAPDPSAFTKLGQFLGIAERKQTVADAARVVESVTGFPGNSILLIEGDGSARDPDTRHALTGRQFEQHVASILRGIDGRFPDPADTVRILVFVHGGLNTFDGALERARELAGELCGTTTDETRYYPLSIVWSSNLPTGLKDQVTRDRLEVVPGPWEKTLTTPIMVGAMVGRGVGESGLTILRQARQDLQATIPGWFAVHGYTRAVYDSLEARQGKLPQIDTNAIRVSWPKDDEFGLARQTGRFFLYWRTIPETFSLSWIVASPGGEAWHSMRGRSQNVVRRPDEFYAAETIDDETRLPALEADPLGSGGLTLYIEALSDSLAARAAAGRPVRLTLFGHSMGTIILNRILERWPDLPYERIVYMAAACSARDFERAAVPVLQRHPDLDFYNLSLHPDNELREINAADIPQRGTLLTWIDNFYTVPETYLDNTLGRWEVALATARIYPESVRGRVHLKAFGIGRSEEPRRVSRFRTYQPGTVGPQRHGDFSEYRFWDPGFYEPELDPQTGLPPRKSITRAPNRRFLVGAGYAATPLFDERGELWSVAAGMRIEGGTELGVGFRRLRGDQVARDKNDGAGREELELWEVGARLDYAEGRLATETFVGRGRATWQGGDARPGDADATYLVLEPVTSYRIAGPVWIGGGWRWTFGADSRRFSDVGLSGWVAQVRLGVAR